ncbi:MAG: hypothetical protein ACPG77_17695, partial [Nannocystaceae bacterium]
VGVLELREGAQTAQPHFDVDLQGLAARYYMRSDWEVSAEVLRDDFKPTDLQAAAKRHNKTCIRNCRYEH